MALPLGPLLGAGASLLGGIFGGNAADKAADAQVAIGNRQLDLNQKVYDETRMSFQPWLEGGQTGNAAYLYELGLGPRPTIGGQPAQIETISVPGAGGGMAADPYALRRAQQMAESYGGPYVQRYQQMLEASRGGAPATTQYRVNGQTFGTLEEAQAFAAANPMGGTPYQGFQKTPGYDFAVSQGMDGIQSSAAARGKLFSGATMDAAGRFQQGYANQEYGNYLNRLAGVSAQGQNAAGMQGGAAGQFLGFGTNALSGIGNAQSAGIIGRGNALTDGINNAISAWGYMRDLNKVPA